MRLIKISQKMTAGAFFMIATAALAGGTPLLIGGGPLDGEYRSFATATCTALGLLFDCHVVETKGTGENVDRLKLPLTDLRAIHLAFVKGNVASEMRKDPGFDSRFTLVRSLAGEAILVLMKEEVARALTNWAGVRDAAFLLSVALPGPKSGDAAVYQALAAVPNSPLSAMEVIQVDGKQAVVAAVRDGKAKLGWIVQYANPDNSLFQSIDDAGLVVMGVVDPDLIQVSSIFQTQVVTVANAKLFGLGNAAKQIETTTVPAAIVARNPNTMPDERSNHVLAAAIERIKTIDEQALLPKQPWIQGLINAATIKSTKDLNSLFEKMQNAAAGARSRFQQSVITTP